MSYEELQKLLLRYNKGLCTSEEVQRVEKALEHLGRDGGDVPFAIKDEIQQRLWSALSRNVTRSEKRNARWSIQTFRLAASLAIILAAGYFQWPTQKDDQTTAIFVPAEFIKISNLTSGVRLIPLSDGSRIYLEPGGEVIYTHQYRTSREIHLTGEAFFEVVKDATHPFKVYTREITTTVLGTAFLVKANKNDEKITVAVKSGKVSVHALTYLEASDSNVEKSVVLLPNQEVVYDKSKEAIAVKLVAHPRMIAKQEVTQYHDASVAEILQDLARVYGVQINYEEQRLSHCTLTASMGDEDLYDQIEIICSAIGARYEVSGLIITISGTPCQ